MKYSYCFVIELMSKTSEYVAKSVLIIAYMFMYLI
jgi:hypothetical protein